MTALAKSTTHTHAGAHVTAEKHLWMHTYTVRQGAGGLSIITELHTGDCSSTITQCTETNEKPLQVRLTLPLINDNS